MVKEPKSKLLKNPSKLGESLELISQIKGGYS